MQENIAAADDQDRADLRARSLFNAMASCPKRIPDWTIQPEHIKEIFRGFSSCDAHIPTGSHKVYRWNETTSAFSEDGLIATDEGQ